MDKNGNSQLDIVIQRWPDIQLEEAQSVFDLLQSPVRARAVVSNSGRPTAAAALIDTNYGLMFMKRYARSVRDVQTIEPYHRYVTFLANRGIHTPIFLPFASGSNIDVVVQKTGDTTAIRGNDIYEVYSAAEGEDRYGKALTWDPPATLSEAYCLGEMLASIDLASSGFNEPRMVPNGMTNTFGLFATPDLDKQWQQWIAQRPSVSEYLSMTKRDIVHDLEAIRPYASRIAHVYEQLESTWIHGDPHISNFLWENDGPCAVIDFGLADRNTALFDLVMALERHAIQWVEVSAGKLDAYRLDVAEAILRGYAEVRPLSDIEKEILPDVLRLAQAEAGLNWLQYYMNGTRRLEDAAWCYDSCFLAHMQWFDTIPGRDLLDGIRRALDCYP